MKRTSECPKCHGRDVVHLDVVSDAGDWTGSGSGSQTERKGDHLVPRRIALRMAKVGSGFFASDVSQPVAETEAYVCTACGYFEEYIKNVAEVPWDEVVSASRRPAR